MKETPQETLSRVKEEIAIRNNFKDWETLTYWHEELLDLIDEVIEKYHSERLKINTLTDQEIHIIAFEKQKEVAKEIPFEFNINDYKDGMKDMRKRLTGE